jgi:hypothetical protein
MAAYPWDGDFWYEFWQCVEGIALGICIPLAGAAAWYLISEGK